MSNAVAIVVLSALLAVAGGLSDRFGRKPILMIGAVLVALRAYPSFYLAASGTIAGALSGLLECPVEETDDRGRKTRTTAARDNRRGIPQVFTLKVPS
jgi:MFS family permease